MLDKLCPKCKKVNSQVEENAVKMCKKIINFYNCSKIVTKCLSFEEYRLWPNGS